MTQKFAISTFVPMCNGPSFDLILTKELITDFLPRRRFGVISTSALGLILAPYLDRPWRVTTNPGVKKRRRRSPRPRPDFFAGSTVVCGKAGAEVSIGPDLLDLFHGEFDAERLLDRGDQSQVGHGVPAGFVVAAEVVRNLRIDVQDVGHDLAQADVDVRRPHPLTPSPIAHPSPGRGGTTALA